MRSGRPTPLDLYLTGTGGLKEPRRHEGPAPQRRLGSTRYVKVGGNSVHVVGIGALARALNRSPTRVRAWEREGRIPTGPWTLLGVDARGRRRVYSIRMIDQIAELAIETGVNRGRVPGSEFYDRMCAIYETEDSNARRGQAADQPIPPGRSTDPD